MIAANFDTCHVYYGRRAAGLYCHRSSRGTLILALWVWRAPCRGVWREIVKAVEAYELTTQGGATDFARLIAAFGPYCPIGGLAVNCFVEPVYTLDADIVATRPPDTRTQCRDGSRHAGVSTYICGTVGQAGSPAMWRKL
jgi:hypothetical protein